GGHSGCCARGGGLEPLRADNQVPVGVGRGSRAVGTGREREKMSSEQEIERSMLTGKDREQLHTIASAMGVKAATRMRKADLIDAILAATAGASASNGQSETPAPKARRVR